MYVSVYDGVYISVCVHFHACVCWVRQFVCVVVCVCYTLYVFVFPSYLVPCPQRSAHNAAIRGFVRFGWRWSWRVAAFVTVFK